MDSVCDKASYIVLIMVGQDYSEELSFLTPPSRVGEWMVMILMESIAVLKIQRLRCLF